MTRHFIGAPKKQNAKYVDKNGVPLKVGDRCYYEWNGRKTIVTVLGLDMWNFTHPSDNAVYFTDGWDDADSIKVRYEVIPNA